MLAAFDPSCTRFGFAFGAEDAETRMPKSGVWQLPGADDRSLDRTLGMAHESVSQLLKMIGASHVVVEAPIMHMETGSHARTISALIQMSGVVRAACYRAGVQCALAPRISILKSFTGRGRWGDPKGEVLARCRSLGWEPVDDNAADACACWAWGLWHFFRRPLDLSLANPRDDVDGWGALAGHFVWRREDFGWSLRSPKDTPVAILTKSRHGFMAELIAPGRPQSPLSETFGEASQWAETNLVGLNLVAGAATFGSPAGC